MSTVMKNQSNTQTNLADRTISYDYTLYRLHSSHVYYIEQTCSWGDLRLKSASRLNPVRSSIGLVIDASIQRSRVTT